jgi:hypothetical protein
VPAAAMMPEQPAPKRPLKNTAVWALFGIKKLEFLTQGLSFM